MAQPDRRFVPGDLQGSAAWFNNWSGQMQTLGASLGFSPTELGKIAKDNDMVQFLAGTAVTVNAYDDAIRSNRRVLLFGNIGGTTPDFPADITFSAPDAVPTGIWQRNNDDIARVRKAPAYTPETGAILGIIPTQTGNAPEAAMQPALKVTTEPGFHFKVAGKMKGMDAIRIDYQRAGSTDWSMVAFWTKLPAEGQITPATAGQPESGRVRGIYIKNNEEFGQYSPEYPITIS